MILEIERKFLVSGDAWRSQVSGARRIRQAYLANGGTTSVRVRVIDGSSAKLTVKGAARADGPALSRPEFEYAIPVADALAMMEMRNGRIVEKTRYLVPAGAGRTWEVDVFTGALEGLVLAEIELERPDEEVALPDWLGREVTGDPRYGNMALALEA
ncbi:CYTH domain-containing protein [Novosphingobium album (ex Hu et al. 2023)]|uniref:CYTH domain-containing protein n=1 Tax=Novosphingobium album (ex Hu et al. 2023) TaxID=2930093 RepID=A0ABT0B5V1_9SPHN|nr:CYTH domain-containing protein [Novosphingobium album (ex Hu et al. 2023)]MCJ2180403.1 CYTH domain-containing protein [Novosphingobium album (ex Hu et al. 2023)]